MALDLDAIKSAVKSHLDAANTTTASTDLSNGMNDRVNAVMKLHPGRLFIQASNYPFITMWYERKDVELESMAGTQSIGRRRGDLDLKIAGFVSENRVTSDLADDSDEQIEQLMENVEEILRSKDRLSLSSSVVFAAPTSIVYHDGQFDEDSIIRAAELTLNIRTNY